MADVDGRATFFEPSRFPWVSVLESNWEVIRAELDEVLSDRVGIPKFDELSPMQRQLIQGRAWKSFFLHVAGAPHNSNAKRCPRTMKLLDAVPGLQLAFFSVLEPDTQLAPHRGPFAGVLRYHLALKIPRDAHLCGIRVGKDTAHWKEGRSLVFDDSHDHEAWNRSDESRVVLFVDFARPLAQPLRFLNEAMLRLLRRAAYVLEIKENLAAQGH